MKKLKFVLFGVIAAVSLTTFTVEGKLSGSEKTYEDTIEEATKINEKITNSNFAEEVNIKLKENGYDASVAIIEVFSADKKVVKIKTNSSTEINTNEIKKVVDQVAKSNGLGEFIIESYL
jgi:N-methylhydantoinase A/oxoprolinase/acetone carboxylase beta subunit